MATTIRTNNVPRDTIDGTELSALARAEFDYLNWDAIDQGEDGATFFRFKGMLYDLGEFMRADHAYGLTGWDGYYSDSAFAGVLIKWSGDDMAQVIVGQYFS